MIWSLKLLTEVWCCSGRNTIFRFFQGIKQVLRSVSIETLVNKTYNMCILFNLFSPSENNNIIISFITKPFYKKVKILVTSFGTYKDYGTKLKIHEIEISDSLKSRFMRAQPPMIHSHTTNIGGLWKLQHSFAIVAEFCVYL